MEITGLDKLRTFWYYIIMTINKITRVPNAIYALDMKYYLKGEWKCAVSPTGAHYWCSDGRVSHLVCKWCKREQEV